MPQHREVKFLPYTPDQLFELVIGFDQYPEFLPWCVAARTIDQGDDYVDGQLAIGHKLLRETFSTRVTFDRPNRINMSYADGPLKYLEGYWNFTPVEGGTEIEFNVDFEMKSKLFQQLITSKFQEAITKMVSAFEGRANQLYG